MKKIEYFIKTIICVLVFTACESFIADDINRDPNNPSVVTLIRSNTLRLRPYTIPGWDLSTFKAVKVAEGVQHNPQTVPTASSKKLGAYTYRADLDASGAIVPRLCAQRSLQFLRPARQRFGSRR